MLKEKGYYRHPTVSGGNVAFVSEDDIWTVPLAGGTARRLTTGLGACSGPFYSPDGKWIAFGSAEEGHREIFVIPSEGGPIRRLTHLGSLATTVGWLDENTVLFRTDVLDGLDMPTLATVGIAGGIPRSMHFGPATHIAIGRKVVIERNSHRADPAHWKRYRGGTAGHFFIADTIDGEFRPFLTEVKGNLSRPMWVGERLYFLSDHEGIGNIYSCKADGSDLRRMTELRSYYARNPATDGKTLVFHAGADIYKLELASGKTEPIAIDYSSQRTQRQRRFVKAEKYLESADLSGDGRELCITARGQIATMGNWWGPTHWVGQKEGVRFRLGRWLDGDEKIVMVSDEAGEERLVVYDREQRTARTLEKAEFGRADQLVVPPAGKKYAALKNHRNQILLADLEEGSVKVIGTNEYYSKSPMSWSPDGRYLAYTVASKPNTANIWIYDTETGEKHEATEPFFWDTDPVWDPGGKYLYFFSERELNPTYQQLQHNLAFNNVEIVCALTLQKDELSPLFPPIREPEKDDKEEKKKKDKGPKPVRIDFEGLKHRMVRLPAPAAEYHRLGASQGKVFFESWPVEGALGSSWRPGGAPEAKGEIHVFDLEKQKTESFLAGVSSFSISADGERMLVRIGNHLRVVKTSDKPKRFKHEGEATEEKGWIDLDRMKLLVEPQAEWKQMIRETWRLQRDHFWREDMSKIEWKKVLELYLPLVARLGCRSEFGDLMWEMQGELGTSHAYEIGGDYRLEPKYNVGFLGARFAWDAPKQMFKIERIWRGDAWNPEEACPLRSPGVMAEEGDYVVAIQGRKLTETFTPYEALLNLAGEEIEVTLRRKSATKDEHFRVRTLNDEANARYRTWVEANKAYVHAKSGGRVGYIHIPNMGADGYAEFHRHFIQEYDYDGLVVDVRYNGGGNVSALLLEKLARKRIGIDQPRWFKPTSYPSDAPAGPMVALTNEFAGSDGDIFSHSFKLMKLGPLLGTRTWGGVIGIWPRHRLVDGGVTTQPEFSHWFVDVGWNVENYGTDPDIVIDNLPHHYRRGEDPQLERAVGETLKALEKQPPFRPVITEFPDLSLKGPFAEA